MLNIEFKFKATFSAQIKYIVNFYITTSLYLPNFRGPRAVVAEIFPKHGCIIGWWDSFRLIP